MVAPGVRLRQFIAPALAARRFLNQAIGRHGVPDKITIDGSDANAAAIKSYNADHATSIEIRQIKYLNNIVAQDHRGVKRVTRPMLGFKSFEAAQPTLTGIELMHMLRKGQLEGDEFEGLSAAEQFYALASSSPHRWVSAHPQEPSEQKLRQNLPPSTSSSRTRTAESLVHVLKRCWACGG